MRPVIYRTINNPEKYPLTELYEYRAITKVRPRVEIESPIKLRI